MNDKVMALLEAERSRLRQELGKVEEAIRVLGGANAAQPEKAAGATKGKPGKRVGKGALENAIITAIGDNQISHAQIKASQAVRNVYGKRNVPNLFIKLDAMIKKGRLKKIGRGKESKYAVHKR